MDIYKNGSSVAIIILHEIYGINQHIKYICDYYATQKYDVYCPNLFDANVSFKYTESEVAYSNFKENVGFHAFHNINELIHELKNQYRKIFLIGFSVGATIAWRCSEHGKCDGVVGYYGSRIRNYTSVMPSCPTLLLFASQDSFDVNDVIDKLIKKENVSAQTLDGNHGFADKYGGNYNENSKIKAFEMAKTFIQSIEKSSE
ncbi:MAG: dienelactone hydrolase family protein [Anaerotignaceae bacterium]